MYVCMYVCMCVCVCVCVCVCEQTMQDYVLLLRKAMQNLTLSKTSPGFYWSASTSLLKTLWEKEKLLETSNFSFSHSVFLPFWKFLCYFQILKGLKFVVWERVKKSNAIVNAFILGGNRKFLHQHLKEHSSKFHRFKVQKKDCLFFEKGMRTTKISSIY